MGYVKKYQTGGIEELLDTHYSGRQANLDETQLECVHFGSKTINRDSTVQLLGILDRKYYYAKEIIVILDNAKYLYSKEVREVIEKSSRLKLVYLPTYSPELNLIERVWRFFKKKVLYNKYCENLAEFRNATIKFFQHVDTYSDELALLLGGGFEGHHYT